MRVNSDMALYSNVSSFLSIVTQYLFLKCHANHVTHLWSEEHTEGFPDSWVLLNIFEAPPLSVELDTKP